MTMDNAPKLGQLPAPGSRRDAIHIATFCVRAGEKLKPGERVRVSHYASGPEGGPHAYEAYDERADGIVDPFLDKPVLKGESFWLLLFPGTITALRHDWTHPAFPSETAISVEDRASSEKWLRDYAERYCASFENMMDGVLRGDHVGFGDDDGPPQYRGIENEFWHHVEVALGRKFDATHRQKTGFSCAC